jgi:hypothetical protein
MGQTIEFTDDELRLLHTALRAYFDDFGHREQDVLDSVKALIDKLPPVEKPSEGSTR